MWQVVRGVDGEHFWEIHVIQVDGIWRERGGCDWPP